MKLILPSLAENEICLYERIKLRALKEKLMFKGLSTFCLFPVEADTGSGWIMANEMKSARKMSHLDARLNISDRYTVDV